ncbi:MAG: hypothetical protein JXX28_03710 [Deltaproteobacteria bacterium]|nr:hypothetical protein [Deltaproteobacteria bacterium]
MIRWWDALDELEHRRLHLLGWALVLFLVHYTVFSFWFVEDTAITFGFVRHAAMGEGFVAWPGGERVEGFSDPAWTLLLLALDWIGVNPFPAAKILGASMGAVTLALAYLWTRELTEHRRDLAPGLAPLLLAFSPQFVLWAAGGLENALFNLALTAGGLLTLLEIRSARAPWSAVAWATLALTRPEGALYGAVAGLLGAAWILRLRGLRATVRWSAGWGAIVLIPGLSYLAFRLQYFGWLQPNTYYAKISGEDRFAPWDWDRRGWAYARGYALVSAQGFLLPLYYVGQTGIAKRWRAWVAVAVFFLAAALLAPGLGWVRDLPWMPTIPPEPELFQHLRIGLMYALFLGLPAVGLGRKGDVGRHLTWSLAVVALFFVLYSGGDWMQEHRLMSMAAVPMAILFADAISLLVGAAPSRALRVLAALPLAVPLVMGLVRTGVFLSSPETTPFDVSRQVFYKDQKIARLHLDHPSALPVDMGAHLWWADFEIRDLPGLIDVPIARHTWQKAFMREYVFEEYKPTFAHVHGGWGRKTGMAGLPELRQRYIEVPPYPVSQWRSHTGNWVRKDLFIEPVPTPEPRPRAAFEGGVQLVDWVVPAPEVYPGGALYLEVVLDQPRGDRENVRLLAFLSQDTELIVREIPPGYDWYMPKDWKRTEQIRNRHTIPLPADMRQGPWALGFALVRTNGEVLPVRSSDPTSVTDEAVFARGEVRWQGVVQVRAEAEALATATQELDKAEVLASTDRCEAAEDWWGRARRHTPPDAPWQRAAKDRIHPAMARCYGLRLQNLGDAEAIAAVREGRLWDHHQPDLAREAQRLADRLIAHGEALLAEGRFDEAYQAWQGAMVAVPTLARHRRRVEELRDWRLGIGERPPWAAEIAGEPTPPANTTVRPAKARPLRPRIQARPGVTEDQDDLAGDR